MRWAAVSFVITNDENKGKNGVIRYRDFGDMNIVCVAFDLNAPQAWLCLIVHSGVLID